MSASKDKERGTWKIYLRYVNWQEMKQIHTKHGFAEWDPQLWSNFKYDSDTLKRREWKMATGTGS